MTSYILVHAGIVSRIAASEHEIQRLLIGAVEQLSANERFRTNDLSSFRHGVVLSLSFPRPYCHWVVVAVRRVSDINAKILHRKIFRGTSDRATHCLRGVPGMPLPHPRNAPARQAPARPSASGAFFEWSMDGRYWRCQRPDGSRRCFCAPRPST